MTENLKSRTKSFQTAQRAGLAAASSAKVILKGVLAFAAITAALVLVGVVYTDFGWRGFRPQTISSWFLRFSREQWIALGVGIVVAFLIVVIPCAKITGRKVTRNGAPPSSPRRIVQTPAVLAVLVLYVVGLSSAYHVSLALGQSRDWAIIHSVYSWVYVGYSFSGWVGEHRKVPLGKTLHEFRVMMGM